MLKSYGVECAGGHVVGGPFDFSVSSSPFGLDFGTLDLGLGTRGLRQGLDNSLLSYKHTLTDVF